jgi:glycosyltransferase involved in cell wall biosynthesis
LETPILSIITINYNDALGLEKTINSVVNQTWNEFEYIIIDGGSSDDSLNVIEKNKNEIAYFVSENDKGIYNAMNKGILAAKGQYVLFLNSGDFLINELVLVKAKEYFVQNSDFICGNLYYELNGESIVKKHPDQLTFSYLVSKTIYHPSTFIKRELFDKFGLYNEENKIVSDWEFFFKALALNGASYLKIDKTITNFDMMGISSTQINLVLKEKKEVFQKIMPYVFNNEKDSYIFDKFRETNKRFKLLKEIDKFPLLRKFATIQLYFIKGLIFFFPKQNKNK